MVRDDLKVQTGLRARFVWKKRLKYWIQKCLVNGETVKQGYINGAYVEKNLAKSP